MKKWVSVFLSFVFALSCMAILPVSAQDQAVLEIGTVTGFGGGRALVPVTLKNAGALKNVGNGNICGIEFNLAYDQSLATLVEVTSSLTAVTAQGESEAWSVDSREYEGQNRAKVMLSDPVNQGFDADGDVEVAVLLFELADAGEEDVTVTLTPEIVDICDNAPHKLGDRVSAAGGSVLVARKQYARLSAESKTAFAGHWVSVFLTLDHAQALSADVNGPKAGNGTLCGIEVDLQYEDTQLTEMQAVTQLVSSATDEADDTWYVGIERQPDGRMKLLIEDSARLGVTAADEIVLCELRFLVAEDVPANTRIAVSCTLVDICDTTAKQLGDFVQTEGFEITVEEKTVSEAVADVIEAIQRVSKVTSINERENVQAARAAYDRLSEEEKAQVTNYADLLASEEKIAELEVELVEDQIAALGEIASLDQEEAVKAARAAYEKLTAAQKALVAQDFVTALEAAEEKIESLKVKLGDVDNDKKVSVSDVVTLRQLIVRGSWTDAEFAAGNLDDSDSNLTVSDVVALRALIVAAG